MTTSTFDIGDIVQCDLCGRDFTNSDEKGGLLFSSKGVCPHCAPRLEADAIKYGEEGYIADRARENESFRNFILRIRGGNNTATITTFELE